MKSIFGTMILLGSLATGAIPFLSATPAEAIFIPSQRIQFAPGRDSDILSGYLGPHNVRSYVFNAMAGQQTYISVDNPSGQPVVLTVFGADGTPLVNGLMTGFSAWNGRLPYSEDYFVRVTNESGIPTSYHLNMTILPPTSYQHPPFVNF